jgi:hypothetical protein
MISRLAGPRFRVRLEIPRTSGWREWGAAAGAFEQRLEAQASATVTGPRIESEMRRGRDYIRVAMSVTVDAPDIAQAAAVAWSIVQQAAAADVSAWDMAGASAEIRPAERALTRRRQGPPGGRSPRLLVTGFRARWRCMIMQAGRSHVEPIGKDCRQRLNPFNNRPPSRRSRLVLGRISLKRPDIISVY